jgi:methyl-accepting chemotaxis protein
MEKKITSLRSQFLIRILITLIIIVVISGTIQLSSVQQQIADNVENQANIMSQSILQGIKETDMATKSIEHQIDLKMESYARHVADLLNGKNLDQINNEELIEIRDYLKISGLTLLARQSDDIVGVRSTESQEIGFSFKKIGYIQGFEALDHLLKGESMNIGQTYQQKNMFILPISQSGSHSETPTFFKYGYYHPEGTNYIIAPYIEANEVYQFTQEVGPNAWIMEATEMNPYVEEIAVLNPQVYKDPSLAEKLYPPLKKIEYGSFISEDDKDIVTLTNIATDQKKTDYIQEVNDKKMYKLFLPIDENRVIYIAFDYEKMSGPLKRNSIILILSGLISLFALFLLTSRFFNGIYENIQRIKTQIKLLEAGDFNARSQIKDESELGDLSRSTNRMAESLQQVLKDTSDQANKAQRLSVVLQADANQSVEKMYMISMETTSYSREKLDDILEFLNAIEETLRSAPQTEKTNELLQHFDAMRQVALDRTAATTDMTITLSDLLKSLRDQSNEMSKLSNDLLQNISKFKL